MKYGFIDKTRHVPLATIVELLSLCEITGRFPSQRASNVGTAILLTEIHLNIGCQ